MKTTRVETLTQNLTERNERTTTRRSLIGLLAGGLLAGSLASVPDAEARRRGGWGGRHRPRPWPCYIPHRRCHGPSLPPRDPGVGAPPLVLPPILAPEPICIATGTVCPATCAPGGACTECCGGVCNANGSCGTPA
jgi:hypothetical protein